MGMDYFRFRIGPDVDQQELFTLADQQANAFQAMYGRPAVFDMPQNEIQKHAKHASQDYITASRALKKQLIFPHWLEKEGHAADIPDISPCFRLDAILSNALFPPLRRVRSCQTFFPHELPLQLERWQTWWAQVTTQKQQPYLEFLYVFETSQILLGQWKALQEAAKGVRQKTALWARKPGLLRLEERIRLSPLPYGLVRPQEPENFNADGLAENKKHVFAQVEEIIALSRQWNQSVKGGWKVHNYYGDYDADLETFKQKANDDWFQDFLTWVQQCVDHDFGLYLDY